MKSKPLKNPRGELWMIQLKLGLTEAGLAFYTLEWALFQAYIECRNLERASGDRRAKQYAKRVERLIEKVIDRAGFKRPFPHRRKRTASQLGRKR